MADVKISNMTAMVTPASGDIFTVVQGGANKKETRAQGAAFLNTDLAGKESEWIPANRITPRTTNGAQSTTREINGITIPVLRFDTSADEGANFSHKFKKRWNEGTVTVVAVWTATGGTPAETVQFEVRGGCFANDAAINVTGFGSAVAIDDALLANDDVHYSAESGAIVLANAAEKNLAFFEIIRDVSDDNLAGDADLIGVELYYTADALSDD